MINLLVRRIVKEFADMAEVASKSGVALHANFSNGL
jgi:hypothetical protein